MPRIAAVLLIFAARLSRAWAQTPTEPGVAVGVRDIDAMVQALKAGGLTVISKNGEPVLNGTSKFCLVRDPNNLYLELFQRGARPQ